MASIALFVQWRVFGCSFCSTFAAQKAAGPRALLPERSSCCIGEAVILMLLMKETHESVMVSAKLALCLDLGSSICR